MRDLPECWELTLESPNLVRLRVVGDVGGAETAALFEHIHEHVRGQPYWLFEVDTAALGRGSADARKVAAERIRMTPEYALALYGAGFGQRMVVTLFLKLAKILDGDRDNSSKFFKDQASAREWLRAEDQRRAADTTGKKATT